MHKKNKFLVSIILIAIFLTSGSAIVRASDSNEIPEITVNYRTHVQKIGWEEYVSNGNLAGTEGKSLRLEAIQINVIGDKDLGIRYKTHVQKLGWQDWVNNNVVSGTTEKGLRLEGIKIELTGSDADKYDIYYKTHVQKIGWQGWVKNGETSGTTGKKLRLEGIKIKIVPKFQEDLSIEEENLIAKLRTVDSNEIVDELFDDFDSDGNYEMAVITQNNKDKRKIWFVTDNNVTKIDERDGLNCTLSSNIFGNTKLIGCSIQGVTGYVESLYYVNDGKLNRCLSYYGMPIQQDDFCNENDYVVSVRSYNGYGHEMTYFLNWDDDEKRFSEYAPIEISQNEFYRFKGSQDAIEDVYENLYSFGDSNCNIEGYYYLKNNVVILKVSYNNEYSNDKVYENFMFNYTEDGLVLNEEYYGEIERDFPNEDYFSDMPHIYADNIEY